MTHYHLTTLNNGLRVASEYLGGAETVSLAVSVDVGSRYETEAQNGLSHLLEHMAFKGTQSRNALAIAEAFENVGANINAYTSNEQTVYYAKLLPKDLPMAVEIFADILQHSSFDAEELERERGVVLQEIAMYNDSPEDLVQDYFQAAVFKDQSIGRSILGTPQHIKDFTRADLQDYVASHYQAPRMVVSAAGKVEHATLLALVNQHFALPAQNSRHQTAPAHYVGGESCVTEDFEQMHYMLGFAGVGLADKETYVAQLAMTILGGGMSSRLFQEVREKRGLAYSVYSYLTSYADCGVCGVYAAAAEEHAAELVPVICDEIVKLAESGTTAAELERAKRQHIAGLLMARENTANVAEWIGKHLLAYGHYKSAEEMIAGYEAVTLEDIPRLLRALLSQAPITHVALGPQKGLPDYASVTARFSGL